MKLLSFLPTRWWSLRAWKTWSTYLHWRLETYGVYHPAGRFNRRALWSMIRQMPSYYRWLSDMEFQRTRRIPVKP